MNMSLNNLRDVHVVERRPCGGNCAFMTVETGTGRHLEVWVSYNTVIAVKNAAGAWLVGCKTG
jgi:hypothetical protein